MQQSFNFNFIFVYNCTIMLKVAKVKMHVGIKASYETLTDIALLDIYDYNLTYTQESITQRQCYANYNIQSVLFVSSLREKYKRILTKG